MPGRGPSDDGEGVPARAALREVVAALQNLHALVRSPRVGPKALAHVVPEIVALLGPLGAQLERGLGLVEGAPEYAAAREELVAFARALAASAAVALEAARAARADARSRLGLELELERLLPPFAAVRELVDALEGSVDERAVELDLRDLADDAFAPPPAPRASWGRLVPVTLAGPLPPASALLRPRLGRALLVGAVGWVGQAPDGAAGPPPVLVRARRDGDGVCVELGAGPPDAAPEAGRETWLVRAAAPIAPAPAALAWVAALCGASARFEGDGPARAALRFAPGPPG